MEKLSLLEKRIVFGVLLLCLALFGLTFAKLSIVQQDLSDIKAEMSEQRLKLLNEIDYQKSLLRPVVDIANNQITIPEIGIQLPYNDITKTFQYSYFEGSDLRITSTALTDHSERQLSCSELAIVNFVNGDAINPWTEPGGSVKLSDDRTMFIVIPIAFENNEASTKACESEIWTRITPTQVAEELRKAKSL